MHEEHVLKHAKLPKIRQLWAWSKKYKMKNLKIFY